jgi:hypothetical protein
MAHGNNNMDQHREKKMNQADPIMGAKENTCPAI